jgi:hypothetical protein
VNRSVGVIAAALDPLPDPRRCNLTSVGQQVKIYW